MAFYFLSFFPELASPRAIFRRKFQSFSRDERPATALAFILIENLKLAAVMETTRRRHQEGAEWGGRLLHCCWWLGFAATDCADIHTASKSDPALLLCRQWSSSDASSSLFVPLRHSDPVPARPALVTSRAADVTPRV